MRRIVICAIAVSLATGFAYGQSNTCAGATTLSVGAALTCGQTTSGATLQVGECYTNYGGGSSETSVWYRIDATNDSLVLNFVQSNSANCFPHIAVYGPFADGGGCLPCASIVYNALQNGDPGSHILLTGLTTTAGNNDYLVQIQGNECGGPGATATNFCISAASPATNTTASGATLIDECGTAFSNTTNGGYYQAGTSTGFNNLDGNAGTTCGTCSQAGDDTPFVINNVSWSTFCSLTAGTWQVTVSGVSGCTLAAPNAGIQASVFTGTTGSLTNVGNSASPLAPGSTYTSPVISVGAGQCAYLMIDGFAGDACNYSVTLTNVSGGCVLLPLGLASFNIFAKDNEVTLSWDIYSELNNSFFTIERSLDGSNYSMIAEIPSIGDHSHLHSYTANDRYLAAEGIYYRLSATDINGETTVLAVKYIKGEIAGDPSYFRIYPNPAGEMINLEFNYPMTETTATVEIFNSSASVYKSSEYQVRNGLNNLSYATEDLPEGTYIIRIITPYSIYTEKFLKKSF
jgi:hypothetical protein